MTLYNLVHANLEKDKPIELFGDIPNYIQIGILPFSRLYLVSKKIDRVEEFREKLNRGRDEHIEFIIKKLSKKELLNFYKERHVLGRLSLFLGESLDLDSSDERINTYINWCNTLKPGGNSIPIFEDPLTYINWCNTLKPGGNSIPIFEDPLSKSKRVITR